MKSFSVNIAGYLIRVESADFDLTAGKRFRNFVDHSPSLPGSEGSAFFPRITVNSGMPELPKKAKCVFRAPFVEEVNSFRIEKNSEFWSIWKKDNDLFIKTSFPLSPGNKKGLLKFSFDSAGWDLGIDSGDEKFIDPLEYPMDGLVLYYLSVIKGDIMIHASGVNHMGKGYVFSGVSGKGKTTISGLWKKAGASIIHDDRLILKKTAKGFRMYNTPVYDDEKPSESDIYSIFIIDHGTENNLTRLDGAHAASAVLANCIQHNWGGEIISGLLHAVTDLCSAVPVYALSFMPDMDVINHILQE